MGQIPYKVNSFVPDELFVDMDPMSLASVIDKFKAARFQLYNPAFISRPSDPISDTEGIVETHVAATIPLTAYERECYTAISSLNRTEFKKEDFKRQYLRLMDDDEERTLPRPAEEDGIFELYYLPEVVPGMHDTMIAANRKILPEYWDDKLAMVTRALTFHGEAAATTFEKHANMLEVRTGRFDTANEFMAKIDVGTGTNFMYKLITTRLYNKWFEMEHDPSFIKFNLTTMVEMISVHFLMTRMSQSILSRRRWNWYLVEYFLRKGFVKGFKNVDFRLEEGNENTPAPLLEAMDQYVTRWSVLQTRRLRRDDPEREDIADAARTLSECLTVIFGTWSSGVGKKEDEVLTPFADLNTFKEADYTLPDELVRFHGNQDGPQFTACHTQGSETDVNISSRKLDCLRRLVDILSRTPDEAFSYRNRNDSRRVVGILDLLYQRFYSIQGIGPELDRLVRKLALIPDTKMLPDDDVHGSFRRAIIPLNVNECSSALSTLQFEKTSLSLDPQMVVDDAWSNLMSFNEFGVSYIRTHVFYDEFTTRYPMYAKFTREWELLDMSWELVRHKHPFATRVINTFGSFKNRKLYKLEEELSIDRVVERVRAIDINKTRMIYDKWKTLLYAGLLGIQDKFILKPTRRVDDEGGLIENDDLGNLASSAISEAINDNYRYVDVFGNPDSHITLEDFIKATNYGIVNAGDMIPVNQSLDSLLREENMLFSGMWINVMDGERIHTMLAELITFADEINTLHLRYTFAWRDTRKHLDLAKIERHPQVGLTQLPFVVLKHDAWTSESPWYKCGAVEDMTSKVLSSGLGAERRIELHHPFEVITQIQRIKRP
jgi:hypothetical protein